MIPQSLRLALPAALLVLLVAGCGSLATLQHKEQASRLRDQLFSYSKLVRWNEFAAARRFVRRRPDAGAAGGAVAGLDAVRVTHYRVVHTDMNEDASEAVVTSSLRFVHRDSGRELSATDRQIRWWSGDEGTWFLDGDVPDFAAARGRGAEVREDGRSGVKLSAREFVASEAKAVSLLGMSGVGKTTLAGKLPKREWFHYSGDYRIGTRYLEEPILDNIKRQAMQVDFLRDLLRSDSIYIRSNITTHNLEPISTFLGKVGDPHRGGIDLEEFRRRQALHREAEIGAMRDVPDFIDKARQLYGYRHFVNDAGGSLCELDEPGVVEILAAHTVILYLRADERMEEEIIRRQQASPKPLYYQARFFEAQLAEYLRGEALASAAEIDPEAFVQWIFPRLVAHRRPRYEAIARRHGYTVDAREVERVRDAADLVELVAGVLD